MTNKPLKEALPELLKEREISERELVRITRRQSGWGSTGGISNIKANDITPTVPGMEAIARALEVKPEYFAEYRLLKARNCLDPNVVGLKAALNGLAAAKAALSGK